MQAIRTNAAVAFKNVLFLTDFSETSTRALAYALAVARHFKARLYPAHVVDGVNAEPIAEVEARRRQQLARQVEYNGLNFHPLLSRCDFESAVPHWITEYAIDLVVMGTHGSQGTERFLLGSTSEWMVRTALCPVLTVGPHVQAPRLFTLAIDRVLYPAGLHGKKPASLGYALALSEERCAHLTLLHVLPEESRNYQDRARVLRFTLDQMQRLLPVDAAGRCRPDLAVDAGEAGERILEHARNEQPDLIVMGLSRKQEQEEGAAPAIAYRVISAAPCPVLTVPETE